MLLCVFLNVKCCLRFIFQMQENANELQYPEATETSDPLYLTRSAALHACICIYVDKLNLCVPMPSMTAGLGNAKFL